MMSVPTSIFSGSDVGDHWWLRLGRCGRSPALVKAASSDTTTVGRAGQSGAVDRTRDRVIDELWADDRAFIAVRPMAVPLVSSR
jgi:hypothetical protein